MGCAERLAEHPSRARGRLPVVLHIVERGEARLFDPLADGRFGRGVGRRRRATPITWLLTELGVDIGGVATNLLSAVSVLFWPKSSSRSQLA